MAEQEKGGSSMANLGALRRSALNSRPGFLSNADKDVIMGAACTVPREGEISLILDVVESLAYNFINSIPQEILERRAYFNPPLSIPSSDEIVQDPKCTLQAYRDLERLVNWNNVSAEDTDSCRRIADHIHYIIDITNNAVLGLPNSNSRLPYEVSLHALDQNARSFAVLAGGLSAAYKTIAIPDLPEVKEDTPAPQLDPALIEQVVKEEKARETHPEKESLKDKLKNLMAGFGAVLSIPLTATGYLARMCFRQMERGMQKVIDVLPDLPERNYSSEGGGSSVLSKLLGGRGLDLGSSTSLSDLSKNRLIGEAPRERNVDLIEKDSSSFSSASSNAVDQYKHLGKNYLGKIETEDPDFYHTMSVTGVYLAAGPNGRMIKLDSFLNSPEVSASDELYSSLYEHKSVPGEFNTHAVGYSTFITFKTLPGPLTLPMPLGYEVTGVKFLDKEGKDIPFEGEVAVAQCRFGSAKIDVPVGIDSVCYRIRKNLNYQYIKHIEELNRLLPKFDIYTGPEGTACSETLEKLNLSPLEKADIWFSLQVDRGYNYSKDPFVGSFIRHSQDATCEAIAGMRLGTCDPFAFFTASGFRNNNVPAVIISGLIPRRKKGFDLRAGHAQAAILTEMETQVYDMTIEVKETQAKSVNLLPRERHDIIRKLPSCTHTGVFQLGAKVREMMLDPNRSREFGFLDRVANALDRRIHRIGEKLKEDSEGENNGHDFSHDYHGNSRTLRYKEVVRTISYYITLERLIHQAEKDGNLKPVYDFYTHCPSMPHLSEDDKNLIPAEYNAARNYNIRKRIISLTGKVLREPQYAHMSKIQAYAWAEKGLPHAYGLRSVLNGNCNPRSLQAEDSISTAEIIEIFSGMPSNVIPFGKAVDLLSSILLVPMVEQGTTDLKGNFSIEQLCALAAIASKISDARNSVDEMITKEAKLQINILCSALGAALLYENTPHKPEVQNAIKDLSRVLGAVNRASSNETISILFKIVHSEQTALRDDVMRFARHIGRDGLLGTLGGRFLHFAEEKVLGGIITDTLNAEKLEMQKPHLWKETFNFFHELGFALPRCAEKKDLLEIFGRELRLVAEEGEDPLNFPSRNAPASYLLSEYSSLGAAKIYRLAAPFVEFGLLEERQLQSVWPQVNEKNVINKFMGSLHVHYSDVGLEINLNNSDSSVAPFKFKAADILCFADHISGTRTELRAIARYNRYKQPDKIHPYEPFFEAMLAISPQLFSRIRQDSDMQQSLLKGLLIDLCQDASADSVYRGQLWLAADSCTRNIDSAVTRTVSDLAALDSNQERNRLRAQLPTNHLFTAPEQLSTSLQQLTVDERRAAILLHAIRRFPYRVDSEFRKVVDDFLSERMGVSSELLPPVQRDRPARSKPMATVWSELFQRKVETPLDLQPLADASRKRVHLHEGKMNDLLPKYLLSRTGQVLIKASTGDFREFRHFSDGEDYRSIDWRSSAKSDAMYVRVKEEDESRPITLVYDLKLLADGLNRYNKNDPVATAPQALTELFTILELAARSNTEVDLILMGRSYLGTFEKVVTRNQQQRVGQFDAHAIASTLAPLLTHAGKIFEAERLIYGETGFYPVNIFEATDMPIKTGRIHIFGIDRRNALPSGPYVGNLHRHSQLVGMLRTLSPASESVQVMSA